MVFNPLLISQKNLEDLLSLSRKPDTQSEGFLICSTHSYHHPPAGLIDVVYGLEILYLETPAKISSFEDTYQKLASFLGQHSEYQPIVFHTYPSEARQLTKKDVRQTLAKYAPSPNRCLFVAPKLFALYGVANRQITLLSNPLASPQEKELLIEEKEKQLFEGLRSYGIYSTLNLNCSPHP